MINKNLILVIIIFIFIFLLIEKGKKKQENFRLFYESSPSTRNMSYDLRCEPIIPKQHFGIMDSSIQPHYRRKCLNIWNFLTLILKIRIKIK